MSVKLILAFLFCFRIFAAEIQVNIWSGINLGGFGDLASNLFMLKQLQRQNPEWKFNYIIDRSSVAKLKILITEFGEQDEFIKDSVRFIIDKGQPLPASDFVLSFSSGPMKKNIAQTAPRAMSFTEYEQYHSQKIISKQITQAHEHYWISTGPKNLGLYINYNETNTELNKTNSLLAEHEERAIKSADLIGLSYTNNGELGQFYLDLYSGISRSSKQNKKIVLFIKDAHLLDLSNAPANIQVINLTKKPFALTEAIFPLLNLPPLVTGDMSLTLALQNKRIFMYERLEHKKNVITDLLDIFQKHLPKKSFNELNGLWNFNTLEDARDKMDHLQSIVSNKDLIAEVEPLMKDELKERSLVMNLSDLINDIYEKKVGHIDEVILKKYSGNRYYCQNALDLFASLPL
jgi:hypothetical protein